MIVLKYICEQIFDHIHGSFGICFWTETKINLPRWTDVVMLNTSFGHNENASAQNSFCIRFRRWWLVAAAYIARWNAYDPSHVFATRYGISLYRNIFLLNMSEIDSFILLYDNGISLFSLLESRRLLDIIFVFKSIIILLISKYSFRSWNRVSTSIIYSYRSSLPCICIRR